MTKVFEINSNNIDEFIKELNNDNKFTMIFVFANWCGHCKAMKPEMNKFKKTIQDDDHDSLVAFLEESDMRENEEKIKPLPFAEQVSGFPSILFKDKDDDKFEHYTGDRTQKAFMKFVMDHAMSGGAKKKKIMRRRRRSRKTRRTRRRKRGGKWSLKYKRSINCKKPKGFSQKQYCKRVLKRKRRTRKNKRKR